MPVYYVEHEGKWNIYSGIVDDFYFEHFVSLDELKGIIGRYVPNRKAEDLDVLLTPDGGLNRMSYEEAMASRRGQER